jgi:RNA polymerase-binding protein DksA
MGAGDWVTGGLRRAVSGVKSAMPGQPEDDATEEPGAVPVTAPDPAEQPAPAAKASRARKPVVEKAPATKASATTSAATEPVATNPPKEPEVAAPEATAAPRVAVARTPRKKAPAKAATKASAAAASDARASDEPAAVAVPTWSDTELDGFRAALESDILRLREELNMGAADMADLLADSSDGAGDDQADAGSKTLEREQEMSVNANARDLLDQSTHALRRLEAGTYGICESCGTLIPAARLRAFPRATLCIACKQAEERR